MSGRAEELVDEFLSPLPWRRPRTSLLMPLVELLLDDELLFWDVEHHDDPRSYEAFFIAFTPRHVITHRVQHRRGDLRAELRTEVALRQELLEVTATMQPDTPYSWLMVVCDWCVAHLGSTGRWFDETCARGAQRWRWFERRWYSLEDVEAPRSRSVLVRYARFDEPITLPMRWDDVEDERNRRFDAFLPQLLLDLP